MKYNALLVTLCALIFISACSDEEPKQQTKAIDQPVLPQKTIQNVSIQPSNNQRLPPPDTLAGQNLQQEALQLQQSLSDITNTLQDINQTYENQLQLSEDKVTDLANQLGRLANQAGKSARVLEETGKTLGNALQQGFEQGYDAQDKKMDQN